MLSSSQKNDFTRQEERRSEEHVTAAAVRDKLVNTEEVVETKTELKEPSGDQVTRLD